MPKKSAAQLQREIDEALRNVSSFKIGDAVQFRSEPGTGGVIRRFESNGWARVATPRGESTVPTYALVLVREEHEPRVRRSVSGKSHATKKTLGSGSKKLKREKLRAESSVAARGSATSSRKRAHATTKTSSAKAPRGAWTTTLPNGEVVSGLLERERSQLPTDKNVHLHYHWAYGKKGKSPAWTMTLPHGEVKSGSLKRAHAQLPADKKVHVHYHWAY